MHVPIQDYSNHVSLCTVSKAVAELAALCLSFYA